ncbi:MAG: hypothetical protein HFJ28_06800 [Clostridia bacterium]|nr:hypothetical protein [Clostridia bacterium]
MTKHENKEKMKKKGLKLIVKIIIVLIFLVAIIGVCYVAKHNYIRDEIKDRTNFILNNGNITKDLKAEVFVQDGIAYISKQDIENFFDNTITYDEKYDQLITSAEEKVAVLPIGKNEIQINSSTVKLKGGAIQKEGTYYVPISELGNVYNINVEYIEENNRVVVNSLDRAYIVATAKKNISVKYKPTGISKTVAKVEQGENVSIANRSEYPVPDGWTRVRTKNGILGYAKINTLGENNTIREAIEKKPKVEGTVSLVWDYYQQTIPDRTGTQIKGVNVVAPTCFRLQQAGRGKINANIGKAGEKYIEWAHEQGYKVWPTISNESLNDTTSEIIRDYKLRESMINQIVDYIVTYDLDGINIDFENMYEADKNYFSRFLIELEPRLNEIGAVLSVDVTAPDGSPNWSLCYDRYTIGKVTDYIMFMAYDQYGASSTQAGTTAGCGWVEENIQKFLGQEGVPAQKLVLGIPFYARVWYTNSEGKLKNEAIPMKRLEEVIGSNNTKVWDENLKQYKVEYTKNGRKYEVWLEDEKSIGAKLDLVGKYNLAGAAYWQKGMEIDSIWNLVAEKLNMK